LSNIEIEDLWLDSLAQEMSDMNHAAFGYKTLRNLSRYETQRRMKSVDYQACGAFINGRLQGFLFIVYHPKEFLESPDELYIQDFSVWPWAQGKGIGSALLNHVLNTVGKDRPIYLTVERNNKAVRLYRKFGFVEVEAPTLIRGNSYIAMRLGRSHGKSSRKFGTEDSETLAKAC